MLVNTTNRCCISDELAMLGSPYSANYINKTAETERQPYYRKKKGRKI